MKGYIIGIDPGLSGCVAIIPSDLPSVVHVFDTPTAKEGKKNVYLVQEMVRMLKPYANDVYPVVAALERVHSMPRQGVSSSFSFGHGYGLWEGILASLGIPYDLVTPQRWQGVLLDGRQKDKDSSRIRAMEIFPSLSEQLKRKSDDGRADALLIAEWRRRQG